MHKAHDYHTATAIRALADRHRAAYVQSATDVWAHHVTRLAGDDVQLDEIELLLIALQRAGHLSRAEALALQVRHLREANSRTSPRCLTLSESR
jgi:hypothetical protein